ncbi:hypothetical protein HPG69_011591 [Diceros bicornis minor]|uniref:Ras-GEF domain-containing protein n=1 Tax=Diceros bicornis minor TaxID=77932 RepID=A0A7J7EHC5_DICBM|nr:hypothetical protein HPG69_011591 [Diceros bicornis minor]
MVMPLTLCRSLPSRCERESTLSLDEACTMLTLKAGTLEKVAETFPWKVVGTSLPGRNIYVTNFLYTFQAFNTTQQSLDQPFYSVVNCIITTCLGDLSVTAQDRARVVEHWIPVAQECHILKNFSLHAILSALQRTLINHLKNTQGKVFWRTSVSEGSPVCLLFPPQSAGNFWEAANSGDRGWAGVWGLQASQGL